MREEEGKFPLLLHYFYIYLSIYLHISMFLSLFYSSLSVPVSRSVPPSSFLLREKCRSSDWFLSGYSMQKHEGVCREEGGGGCSRPLLLYFTGVASMGGVKSQAQRVCIYLSIIYVAGLSIYLSIWLNGFLLLL